MPEVRCHVPIRSHNPAFGLPWFPNSGSPQLLNIGTQIPLPNSKRRPSPFPQKTPPNGISGATLRAPPDKILDLPTLLSSRSLSTGRVRTTAHDAQSTREALPGIFHVSLTNGFEVEAVPVRSTPGFAGPCLCFVATIRLSVG